MECSGLWDQTVPSRLVVEGALCHRELSLTAARVPLQVDLDVPPGTTSSAFAATAGACRPRKGVKSCSDCGTLNATTGGDGGLTFG